MNDPKMSLQADANASGVDKTDRREVIKAAAAFAFAGVALNASSTSSAAELGKGKPGDFEFLAGEWKIKNRRLKKDNGHNEWDEFEGEATCWTILNGVGSVEELRIPARNFAGMGLRLLDIERGVWNDFWVNAKNPVLATPGQEGQFENGVGTFIAEEKDEGKSIVVKGVWDRITPDSCRWYQATSADGGKEWEVNWSMDWTRVQKPKTK